MDKIRRNIVWLVVASEISHLFCCVLPTLAAVLSLAVGVGILPTAFTQLHDFIHAAEVIFIGSRAQLPILKLPVGLAVYYDEIELT